jgi:hypothetical protein
MHEAGKGSKQRPTNHESYSTNYDLIFGKCSSKQDNPALSVPPVTPTPLTTKDGDIVSPAAEAPEGM